MLKKIILSAAAVCISLSAQAQLKIGYTNPIRILSQMPEVDEVDKEIQELVTARDYELTTKAGQIEKQFAEFERNRAGMTESRQKVIMESLMQTNQAFEEERQNYMAEVRQKRNDLMEPVLDKLDAAIKQASQELGLDLVLNEGTTNGDLIVFFAASEKMDITDKVVEILNRAEN
ncbi:OmpH family outer membrane protein [Balneola sp. MJW-20]|uniref:OmpH family outer membrane protein n=1 Tax=Gracilimonas aurantiaca TaxID=3234185 RepID=UPI00346623BA